MNLGFLIAGHNWAFLYKRVLFVGWLWGWISLIPGLLPARIFIQKKNYGGTWGQAQTRLNFFVGQGVVTCMSHAEVFATGNKIELSDQSPFESLSRNHGNFRIVKIKGSRTAGPIWPLIPKNQAIMQELLKGRSSNLAHFLLIKIVDPHRKRFNRRHISDYPL